MLYMTKSELHRFIANIHIPCYSFPPVSLKDEINRFQYKYIGWALWVKYSLPKPYTMEQKESMEMIDDFLKSHLTIISDEEAHNYQTFKL